MEKVIIAISLLFFVGHILGWFFEKTKIPDLLILIGIGYILGPLTGTIQPHHLGQVGAVLSTIALIVILYQGGLNLSSTQLKVAALPALGISIVGFLLIVLVAFGIGLIFQPWTVSLLMAIGLGSTSSAIVIPMVKFLSIGERTKTILALESAFTDVITIVLFLVFLDAISKNLFSAEKIFIGLGPVTLIAIVIGVLSGILWAFSRKKWNHVTSITFAGESFALLIYGVSEFINLNGAMSVLALGFTLGNLNLLPNFLQQQVSKVPVSFKDLSLLNELTFLLKTFFFLYLGMLINISSVKIVVIAIGIVLCIFITRFIITHLLFSKKVFTDLDAISIIAMGPRGLACAVLATLPAERGIEGAEWIQQILFATIPLSILFTAFFVFMCEKPNLRKKLRFLSKGYPESSSKS